jgi:hypothetical protein
MNSGDPSQRSASARTHTATPPTAPAVRIPPLRRSHCCPIVARRKAPGPHCPRRCRAGGGREGLQSWPTLQSSSGQAPRLLVPGATADRTATAAAARHPFHDRPRQGLHSWPTLQSSSEQTPRLLVPGTTADPTPTGTAAERCCDDTHRGGLQSWPTLQSSSGQAPRLLVPGATADRTAAAAAARHPFHDRPRQELRSWPTLQFQMSRRTRWTRSSFE